MAADYNVGEETSGGNYGDLRAAQEAWFREQLANLPDDPAEAAARLAELSARADELNAEWQGRDATFVGPDGQPITGAEYFAQVSASLSVGANENTVIADRNAALPDALAPVTTTFQPNAGLGDRFNADRSAIDARVAAANAIEDPAERAEDAGGAGLRYTRPAGAVDRHGIPKAGRSALTTTMIRTLPGWPTTAPEWWGDYAAGIETAADANRGARLNRTPPPPLPATARLLADLRKASASFRRCPLISRRLRQAGRGMAQRRPDNELVRDTASTTADALALDHRGEPVVYQTPSELFRPVVRRPAISSSATTSSVERRHERRDALRRRETRRHRHRQVATTIPEEPRAPLQVSSGDQRGRRSRAGPPGGCGARRRRGAGHRHCHRRLRDRRHQERPGGWPSIR